MNGVFIDPVTLTASVLVLAAVVTVALAIADITFLNTLTVRTQVAIFIATWRGRRGSWGGEHTTV